MKTRAKNIPVNKSNGYRYAGRREEKTTCQKDYGYDTDNGNCIVPA
jgi:hypothetical protein